MRERGNSPRDLHRVGGEETRDRLRRKLHVGFRKIVRRLQRMPRDVEHTRGVASESLRGSLEDQRTVRYSSPPSFALFSSPIVFYANELSWRARARETHSPSLVLVDARGNGEGFALDSSDISPSLEGSIASLASARSSSITIASIGVATARQTRLRSSATVRFTRDPILTGCGVGRHRRQREYDVLCGKR